MKKTILTIALSLLAVCSFGKSALKVTSGSTAALKAGFKATVEVDFSQTAWEKEGPFSTWAGADFATFQEKALSGFAKGVNSSSKKVSVVTEAADYKFVIKPSMMEQHDVGGWMWGQMTMFATGTMELQDASGNVVCVFSMKKLPGKPDFVPADRLEKLFENIGWNLAKTK